MSEVQRTILPFINPSRVSQSTQDAYVYFGSVGLLVFTTRATMLYQVYSGKRIVVQYIAYHLAGVSGHLASGFTRCQLGVNAIIFYAVEHTVDVLKTRRLQWDRRHVVIVSKIIQKRHKLFSRQNYHCGINKFTLLSLSVCVSSFKATNT